MLKKSMVVGIVFVLMLVSIPNVVSYEIISEEEIPLTTGGLVDNIPIRCHGTYAVEVALNFILTVFEKNNPITYIGVNYANDNDVPITITEHYQITTKDGRTIFDESWTVPFKINPNHAVGGCIPILRRHLVDADYLRGFFYLTADFHIAEDDSHKTLLFYGYFYNFGALIFNRNGRDITE